MLKTFGNDKEFWEDMALKHGPAGCGYLGGYQPYEEFLRKRAFERQIKVREGMKVLDIGAGVGNWCRYLAGKGACATGVDISARMIEMARQLTGTAEEKARINYRSIAIQDADFSAESFDLIISVTVLQHITQEHMFTKAVKNIVRMLKTDGRICLIEYSPRQKPQNSPDAHYIVYRNANEWRDVFAGEGCALVSQTPVRFLTHRCFAGISKIKPAVFKNSLMAVPIFFDILFSLFLSELLLNHCDLFLFVFKKNDSARLTIKKNGSARLTIKENKTREALN